MSQFTKWFIVCACVLFHSNYLYAQKAGAVFHHLTTTNGLSSNRALIVMQDSRGFYWIGTEDGLNRFDGSTCKVFRNIKNDSTSISNNTCNIILEDANGDIWIATHMGVNRYSYKQGKFERFFLHHPTVSFDRTNLITGLQKDEQGNIWITSVGLWQYNIYSGQWKTFLNDPKDSSTIRDGIVSNLQFDIKNNSLWMRTEKSYVLFDIKNNRFYHNKNNPSAISLLSFEKTSPFVIDISSRIWFADYKSQLTCFDYLTNSLQTTSYKFLKGFFGLSGDHQSRIWIHYWSGGTVIYDPLIEYIDSSFLARTHPQSVLEGLIKGFYTDASGIYWIFSSGGINIYDPNEQSVQYFLLPQGRKTSQGSANVIQCMAEQDENTVWLGTNTGLCKYDLSQNQLRFLDHLPFHKNELIKCLYKYDHSTLWIGTGGNVYVLDIPSERIIRTIPVSIHTDFITSDAEKNIWVGSWNSGLYKISPSGQLLKHFTKIPGSTETIQHNNFIGWLTDSSKSHLWLGYNGGFGFSHLDLKENKFSHFKIQTQDPFFNAINTVSCFSEEQNGNLWIGTNGGGLFYFDRKKNSFTIYTQSDGLKSNYVNSILPDESGHLWLSTSNGLSIVNAKTGEINETSVDLEMNSNDFLPNGLLRKNKKMLFFSGSKLIEVDPVSFRQNSYPSKILLSSFKIFDKEYYPDENQKSFSASLSHQQNFFSIEYSLLSSNPGNSTQYAYKLEGFDKDWSNAKERRIAYYTNVPPGNYTFLVRASDAAGKNYFSKPVLISISPPFWKRAWFIAAIAILLIAGLYSIYRYRIVQLKKVYALRTKISQDLHDEVGSALSGISLLGRIAQQQLKENKVAESAGLLHKISDYCDDMVNKVSDIVWSVNPQNESLDKMLNRLQSYASSFAGPQNIQFNFRNETGNLSKKIKMPVIKNLYLICKEAVNNALKYSQCRTLNCFLLSSDSRLQVLIEDDGNGFDPQIVTDGNGLKNMQKRAEELKTFLQIESMQGKGTKISLQIKIP